jgi:hypothetical protein
VSEANADPESITAVNMRLLDGRSLCVDEGTEVMGTHLRGDDG